MGVLWCDYFDFHSLGGIVRRFELWIDGVMFHAYDDLKEFINVYLGMRVCYPYSLVTRVIV